MKKKKITTLAFLLFAMVIQAQISTTNSKVSDQDVIIKTVKVYDCKSIVPVGSSLKTETIKKGKDKTYTITTEKKDLLKPEPIEVEKTIKIRMTNFGGVASLFTKEDSPGKIFIDYWLNPKNTIPANVTVNEITRTLECPADAEKVVASDYKETIKTRKTTERETKYLLKIETAQYDGWKKPAKNSEVPDWFTHTDLIIEVLKKDGNLDYALVDKYDRDVIYELEIKNRAVFTTIDKSIEYSPLTIPLKLRFGYSENSIDVKEQFTADANIGAYMGIRIARLSSRKEQEKLLNLPETAIRFGPFISLSTVALSKSNTTAGNTPLLGEDTDSIGLFSYGFGGIVNIKRLNIGVFYGWETGFGVAAENWNYNNRGFLGLGLGFDLDSFKKQ
tara:strand:- start:25203 stop:26369 length:1167 start_codon:yes stop_codon:yes gene_type:complete